MWNKGNTSVEIRSRWSINVNINCKVGILRSSTDALEFRLCNACHLRWKSAGKPSDGYSSENYPPPYYDITKVKVKVKVKKIKVKGNNLAKENLEEQKREDVTSRKRKTPPSLTVEKKIPQCTQCKTLCTAQWRKGPHGMKT